MRRTLISVVALTLALPSSCGEARSSSAVGDYFLSAYQVQGERREGGDDFAGQLVLHEKGALLLTLGVSERGADPYGGTWEQNGEFLTFTLDRGLASLGRGPYPAKYSSARGTIVLEIREGEYIEFTRGSVAEGASTLPPSNDRLDEMLDALTSPDPYARIMAAGELQRMGPSAAPALSALMQSLDTRDSRVLVSCLRAIGAIGPEAQDAVPRLLSLVPRSYPDVGEVGEAASDALFQIGQPAVPFISSDLEGGTERTILRALNLLERMGSPAKSAIPQIVELCSSQARKVREAALDAIKAIEISSRTMPAVLDALYDDRSTVQLRASEVLWAVGPKHADCVPELCKALKFRDEEVRISAMCALCYIGTAASDAVPYLKKIAKNRKETDSVRVNAMLAMAKIGANDPQVPIALAQLMHTRELGEDAAIALYKTGNLSGELTELVGAALDLSNATLRQYALAILTSIGHEAKRASPQIVKLIRNPRSDAATRASALRALSAVGAPAELALPILLEGARSTDAQLRSSALRALAPYLTESSEAESVVVSALGDPDGRMRASAVKALGAAGDLGQASQQYMYFALFDVVPTVRFASLKGIANHAESHVDAAPKVATMRKDGDSEIREAARRTLQRLGGEAVLTDELLSTHLRHEDARYRVSAILFIASQRDVSRGVIPALVDALHDSSSVVRSMSLSALLMAKHENPAMIPLVVKLLDDKSKEVRVAASTYLSMFGSGAKGAVQKLAYLVVHDPACRIPAMRALGAIGPDAEYAVPELIRFTTHYMGGSDDAARLALIRIGQAAPERLDDLVELLEKHRQETVLFWCARMIGGLGPKASVAAPRLAHLLRHDSEKIQAEAVRALVSIGEAAVPLMVTLLTQEEEHGLRATAAKILGATGTQTASARDALQEGLEDESPRVRAAAKSALESISRAGE